MTEPVADVATAVAIGRRHRQEDAVLANFSCGEESGFAVLSDGMGGHDDGDLASRIIVSEVFGAFNVSGRHGPSDPADLRDRLRNAVLTANQSLRNEVEAGSGQEGMGGTVITAVVQDAALSWISIGDSGLFLFRRGGLTRLNEIHSLAPQIDLMVDQGVIDAETARTHPQRSCLTSALVGGGISKIDCPGKPLALEAGDIVLMASDGLEVLEPDEVRDILNQHRSRSSREIASALMQAVASAHAPEQDNISVIVIKPVFARHVEEQAATERKQEPPFWAPLRAGIASLRHHVIAPLTGRPAP